MQCLTVGSRSPFHSILQNLRIRNLCVQETDDFFITKDKYFHEARSQLIVLIPWISSDCSVIKFSEYVEHLFQCEIFCIFDGMPII